MNKKAPLRLSVPFKAKQHLHKCLISNPPTFRYERESFYWLVDTIISFASVKDLDFLKGGSLVTVSSEYMDQHITKGQYAKHMRYLEEIGIVEGDHSYCIEKGEAKGYMICVEYLTDIDIEKDKVFIHSSSSIWKAVEEYRIGKQSHKALPTHIKALKKCFNKTGFDYNGAKEFVLSMEIKGKNKDLKRRAYLKCIDNLEDKKHRYFNVSYSNGRLNSNYTNLLTELRQFIKGDKIMIDLSNSQPYLLSQIFNSISRDMSYCSFTVQAASKMAKILDTTVGYLLGETEEVNLFKDKKMMDRFNDINELNDIEKESLFLMIDYFIKASKINKM